MEQTDGCQRGGGLGNWMKEVEGIKQKNIHNTQTQTTCGGSQRGRGWGVGESGQRRETGKERDFAWGDGCTMQHADDVLF